MSPSSSAFASPAMTRSASAAPSHAAPTSARSEALIQKTLGICMNPARRDPSAPPTWPSHADAGVNPSLPMSGSTCFAAERNAKK